MKTFVSLFYSDSEAGLLLCSAVPSELKIIDAWSSGPLAPACIDAISKWSVDADIDFVLCGSYRGIKDVRVDPIVSQVRKQNKIKLVSESPTFVGAANTIVSPESADKINFGDCSIWPRCREIIQNGIANQSIPAIGYGLSQALLNHRRITKKQRRLKTISANQINKASIKKSFTDEFKNRLGIN